MYFSLPLARRRGEHRELPNRDPGPLGVQQRRGQLRAGRAGGDQARGQRYHGCRRWAGKETNLLERTYLLFFQGTNGSQINCSKRE